MPPRLYVSFWNIELSNLPVGSFRRRLLPMTEARSLIHAARASGMLLCVAKEDLGAPYGERAREKHRELCAALRQHADIEIELEDFFGRNSANPLCLAEVGEQRSLLVVDCHYAFDRELGGSTAEAARAQDPAGDISEEGARRRVNEALKMRVVPDSVEFYVFEQVAPGLSVGNGEKSGRARAMDRLVMRVQTMIEESGNPEGFNAAEWVTRWISRPLPALGGRTPDEFLETEDGQALVENLILRMQSGAYS